MTSRSPIALAGAIAALTVMPTAALAATHVSVRVEGSTSTLLPATTVSAPSSGSVTKGGTPSGECPARSAAGALQAATHGRWGGTYSSGLGIEVNTILGTTLSFAKGAYWGFFVNNRFASKGVCDTKLTSGEQLLFAAVPAKGKTPLPIVLGAPTRVTVGRPFTVRAYDYPGSSSATKPVSGVKLTVSEHGRVVATTTTSERGAGATRVSIPTAGRATIVASRPGAIRSAGLAVTVAG